MRVERDAAISIKSALEARAEAAESRLKLLDTRNKELVSEDLTLKTINNSLTAQMERLSTSNLSYYHYMMKASDELEAERKKVARLLEIVTDEEVFIEAEIADGAIDEISTSYDYDKAKVLIGVDWGSPMPMMVAINSRRVDLEESLKLSMYNPKGKTSFQLRNELEESLKRVKIVTPITGLVFKVSKGENDTIHVEPAENVADAKETAIPVNVTDNDDHDFALDERNDQNGRGSDEDNYPKISLRLAIIQSELEKSSETDESIIELYSELERIEAGAKSPNNSMTVAESIFDKISDLKTRAMAILGFQGHFTPHSDGEFRMVKA